jgi:hypothetical protein
MDSTCVLGCSLAAFPLLLIVWLIWSNRHLLRRRPTAAAALQSSEGAESVSANQAITHMRNVVSLAERLAARGIVITYWMTDWAGFGCWSLRMRISSGTTDTDRGNVLVTFWDGRDRLL